MSPRFLQLEALHLLWFVLALVVILGLTALRQRRRLARFAEHPAWSRLAPTLARGRRSIRAALVVLALVALVAALIDPRWGVRYEEVQQRGVDVVVLLDVSRSMLAEDVRPDRLGRAKQFIGDLLDELAGDRVALITFAGTATVRCPITVDYGALRLALNDVDPGVEPRGGSLLGDALRMAGEAFTDDIEGAKLVLVLTDGEDHGSFPVEAAAALRERGIRVTTVGIGDDTEGARIPIEQDGQRIYLTYDDQEVWSRMDADALREIALAGGGAFVPAGVRQLDLGRVFRDRLAPSEDREFEASQIRRYTPRYQWFAGAAVMLLLLEALILDRRGDFQDAVPKPETLA